MVRCILLACWLTRFPGAAQGAGGGGGRGAQIAPCQERGQLRNDISIVQIGIPGFEQVSDGKEMHFVRAVCTPSSPWRCGLTPSPARLG